VARRRGVAAKTPRGVYSGGGGGRHCGDYEQTEREMTAQRGATVSPAVADFTTRHPLTCELATLCPPTPDHTLDTNITPACLDYSVTSANCTSHYSPTGLTSQTPKVKKPEIQKYQK